MAWPHSQDYNEAIQSPKQNFADPDLKRGEAATNALGLPMPYSGNFADVYQVRCPDGTRWAVKCFTREVPGLRERYAEIGRHLRQAKLPFTVDFTYLEQGIRVAGQWHPALKMQWVEGLTLNQFVAQYLDKPAMLEALLQIWGKMASRLRLAEVGHCDLQHGNVLLVPGSGPNSLALKVIDYDGMWVPALAGKKTGELGHPCYQHPQRAREGTYSIEVDRFPVLLVATALRALKARGKALWDKYDNGDNLLFKEGDFRDPKQSGLFQGLLHIGDPPTVALAVPLLKSLWADLALTPLLEELTAEAATATPAPARGAARPSASVPAPRTTTTVGNKTFAFDEAAQAGEARSKRMKPGRRAKAGGVPGWAWVAGAAAAALLGGGAAAFFLAKGGGPDKPPTAPQVVQRQDDPAAPVSQKQDESVAPPSAGQPPMQPTAAERSDPADALRREAISAEGLTWAGGGDSTKAPLELAAVLGEPSAPNPDDRLLFHLPQAGGAPVISPDGKTLASANGNTVVLYDLETGKELRTLRGHDQVVMCVAFGPDGDLLVSASADHAVKLWDTASGRELHTFSGPTEHVIPVAFSPDGKSVAANGWVWNVSDYAEVYHLPPEGLGNPAFSPDGKWLAVGDGVSVRLWNAATGEPGPTLLKLQTPPPHYTEFWVAFSADGKRLAGGSEDMLVVWDATTLGDPAPKEIRRLDAPGACVQFSPDGETVYSCKHLNQNGAPHVIRRLDLRTGVQSALPALSCQGEWAHFALSKDGKTIAAASDKDNDVSVYDAATGRPLSDPSRMPPALAVAFSPDGKLLASAGGDRRITLWDLSAGKKVKVMPLPGQGGEVKSLAFRPDGQAVADGETSGTVRVWGLGGQVQWSQLAHRGPIEALAFSPNGDALASAGADGDMRLWDAATGAPRQTLKGPTKAVRGTAFSPDGATVAAGSADHTLWLWDAKTGEPRVTLLAPVGLGAPAFLPDGKRIAAVADDGSIALWVRQADAVPKMLSAGAGALSSLAVRPDGKTLTAVGRDGTALFWDVDAESAGPSSTALCPPGLRLHAAALNPDGTYLAAGGADGPVGLYRLENIPTAVSVAASPKPETPPASASPEKPPAPIVQMDPADIDPDPNGPPGEVRRFEGHTAMIWGVAYSPDGRMIASASEDHTLRLWDPKTGKAIRTIATGAAGHVAFSPDGRLLLSGGQEKTMRLWDIASGRELQHFDGHTDTVDAIAFTSDTTRVFSASRDGTCRIWDPETGREIGRCGTGPLTLYALGASPDGDRLLFTANDNSVCLWDVKGQRELKRMPGHTSHVYTLAFSRDEKYGLSGGVDRTIFLWDLVGGKQPRRFEGHTGSIHTVVFSPDGRRILSASEDKTVRLWDVDSGREICRLEGHTDGVFSAAFSPDGRYAISGAADKTVRLWRLPPPEFVPPPTHPAEIAKPDRTPVPDDASIADAMKKIKEVYKLDAKRKPEEVLTLANTLLKDGLETKDMPALRFALLREARDQAGRAGGSAGLGVCMKAADELANTFQVDAREMRTQGLEAAARIAGTPAARADVAAFALAAADDPEEAEDYEAAGRLVKAAETAAAASANKPLEAAANGRAKELASLREAFEAVKPSVQALAAKPDDADAALAVGRFYCLEKGDWDRGLSLLAKGSDAKLKDLARNDLASPAEGDDQAKLADAFKAAADGEGGTARTRLLSRACSWYQLAEGRLTGFAQSEAKRKRTDIEKTLAPQRPVVLFAMWGADAGWIDVATRVRALVVRAKDQKASFKPGDVGPPSDPAPRKPKALVVVYRYRGWVYLSTTGQGDAASIPGTFGPLDTPPGAPAPGQDLVVLDARFGADNAWEQKTANAQQRVQGGTLTATVGDLSFGDPAFGKSKAMVLLYRQGGKVRLSLTGQDETATIGTTAESP